MTTKTATTWSLANVEKRAARWKSFDIPPREPRERMRAGEFAKLVFLNAAGEGERMWVEIERVERDREHDRLGVAAPRVRYHGSLRNAPVATPGLEIGSIIEFGPEHIADCDVP